MKKTPNTDSFVSCGTIFLLKLETHFPIKLFPPLTFDEIRTKIMIDKRKIAKRFFRKILHFVLICDKVGEEYVKHFKCSTVERIANESRTILSRIREISNHS